VKLRIRGDSIRLRLTRAEVETLRVGGHVEETVSLAPVHFSYRIERSAPSLSARFDGKCLVVAVPDATVREFCESDRVGFDGTDGAVRILVEKDWQCLAPRDEEDEDAFPHPAADKG
jgi:hypothetical protein